MRSRPVIPEFRAEARAEGFGIVNPFPAPEDPEQIPTEEELRAILERNWEYGGLTFLNGAPGLVVMPELNEVAAEFVRGEDPGRGG